MHVNDISPENLDIVFETGNFDYEKMKNLIRKCQANPGHQMTDYLNNIKVSNIVAKKKDEEPLLQVADLIAHSLYRCVDKCGKNLFTTEPRYIRELSTSFFGNPQTQLVPGAGLYLVHTIKDLELDPDVEQVINEMVATTGAI